MNVKFIPIISAAFFTLLVTVSPVPNELHTIASYIIFGAAICTLIRSWNTLRKIDVTFLLFIIIFYNLIFLLQLGSGLAWGGLSLLTVIYFTIRLRILKNDSYTRE